MYFYILKVSIYFMFYSFILFILFLLSLFISKTSFSYGDTNYKKINIIYGDTLWSIASNEKKYNEYYYNKDIRYIVDDIKKANNMINSNIYEGQEILIPTL